MISYDDFRRLAMDASECQTLEGYLAEVGGSVLMGDAQQATRLLEAIYQVASSQYNYSAIAKVCGQSMRGLAISLGIPVRTAENWAANRKKAEARRASDWMMEMVAYTAISNWIGDKRD